ncbi:MAG: hypothetical protein EAX86_05865 [Candidatus Heimdallarchaeota archaeon]|nr:hypothetical protein [Candidatus Heimdallarchaeota archaeon]
MSRTTIWIATFSIGLILFFTLFFAFVLLQNSTNTTISIEIVTKKVNSCPNNFAWFIVNISSIIPQSISEIIISTNVSIVTEYQLWANITPSVLEIFLFPNSTHIGQNILLEVTIGETSDNAVLEVWDWGDSEHEPAYERLTPFLEYFEQSKPQFNINVTTPWDISCNDAGLLIVEHYLFKSEFWELELSWHVMIPPYDWIQVYLRHRAEIKPSWGGMIESWNLTSNIINETTPPDQVFRPQ